MSARGHVMTPDGSLTVGYAAMLEQFHPTELLETAPPPKRRVPGVMAADHVQPWVPQQGQAAYVWSFMTAAMERTKGDVGPGVTCPRFRQHPAMIAQAAATMAAMYPGPLLARPGLRRGAQRACRGRLLARGARADRAHVRGDRDHPQALQRQGRQAQGRVLPHGDDAPVDDARDQPPPIYVATAGPITAKKVGALRRRADHGGRARGEARDDLREVLGGLPRGGQGPGRRSKFILQLHLSWAPTDEEALANAMPEWPNGGMKFPKQDIRSPHDLEQMAKLVRPEDFQGRMLISSDLEAHRRRSSATWTSASTRSTSTTSAQPAEWIEVFGREVLPHLSR